MRRGWDWFGALAPARQALLVIGLFVALTVGGSVIGAATGGGSSDSKEAGTAPDATIGTTSDKPKYHYLDDADGFQCRSDKVDKHSLCPRNPDYGKTAVQLHAEAVAKLRAEKRREQARLAAARAAERARQAAIRAANAWHAGYVLAPVDEVGASGPVYMKYVNGLSCQDYALDGCWHLEVIARDGCPTYVAAQGNEYQGGRVVGSVLDNNGNGIPPKTPISFELDADQSGVELNDVTISCS